LPDEAMALADIADKYSQGEIRYYYLWSDDDDDDDDKIQIYGV